MLRIRNLATLRIADRADRSRPGVGKRQAMRDGYIHPEQPREPPGTIVSERSLEEIAQRLVEKYMQSAFTDREIVGIFSNPLSGGAYDLYSAKGEKWVQGLVARVRRSPANIGSRP